MTVMLLEWVITSSFLILTVLALRAVFGKRVSARLRYALWAAVLVRLLVPVQLFTSPLAGTRFFSEGSTEQTVTWWPITSEAHVTPGPDDVLSVDGQIGASTLRPDPPQASDTPVRPGLSHAPGAPAPPNVPEPPTVPIVAPAAPAAPDLTKLPAFLGWIWLGGCAALALVLAASNLRFALRLRRSRVPLEGADCPLPVYTAAGLPSPCLFGLARPAVYVTPEAAADPVMLRHVLAHEYTHFRQGDHLWSLLRCAALAVHWWNPLVWVSVKLSRRDGELSCDESALKRLGDGERLAYGNTLLALVTAKPNPGDLLCFATTMAGEKRSLKERISRIAHAPRRWLWAAAAVVLVTALACVCAFGSAEEPEQTDGPDPDPTPSAAGKADTDITPSLAADPELVKDGWALRNTEALSAAPDLNRNGVPETIVVGDLYFSGTGEGESESQGRGVGVLEEDELLWMGLALDSGGGATSFLLYTADGKDYLMEFITGGHMGKGYKDYRIFTLENGAETTVWENGIMFDYCTDSSASVKDNFDPLAVAAFVDETDSLLERCTLLADSSENYWKDPLQVNLRSTLEGYCPGFRWDGGQTTLENAVRFKLMAEHPAFARDLDGDMHAEWVSITEFDGGLRLELRHSYTGELIWSDEGHYAHAGWNAVFLCTLDGKDYLLRYHPYMGQGWCNYGYELFTLTRDGREETVRESSVTFDINFGGVHKGFDPEAIAAFMDEINGLLAHSVQLINTDENLWGTFRKEGRLYDSLWWLDSGSPVFVRDEEASLLENLREYQAKMEAAAGGPSAWERW